MDWHSSAGSFCRFKQIIGQLTKSPGLFVQHIQIFRSAFAAQPFCFKQIDIGDHGCQGRFEIMRHVGYQLSLHPLIFDFVLHGQSGCFGNLVDVSCDFIQLAIPALVHRYLIVKISAFDFIDASADLIVFLNEFRCKHQQDHEDYRCKKYCRR